MTKGTQPTARQQAFVRDLIARKGQDAYTEARLAMGFLVRTQWGIQDGHKPVTKASVSRLIDLLLAYPDLEGGQE